jgi:hypothetical protein
VGLIEMEMGVLFEPFFKDVEEEKEEGEGLGQL